MQSILIPVEIQNLFELVHKEFVRLHELSLSKYGFFKPHKKPKKFIEDIIEKHYPKEHYGEAIDNIYHETSSLRSLLIDALDYGFELGRNPSKIKKHEARMLLLSETLQALTLKIPEYKNREFPINALQNINRVNEHIISFEYREKIYTTSIMHYLQELNRIKLLSEEIRSNKKDFHFLS